MTRKFEVQFPSHTDLAPSFVYVSPSPASQGQFAVGVLYVSNRFGNFQSPAGIARSFGFEQSLCKTEADAIQWAKGWLSNKSGSDVTLNEVTD